MNNELEINLSDEEMEKIRNILINNKGLRHYGFQRENGEYLDLVEYKDYEQLQSNWNSLREYTEQHLKILERRMNTFGTINPDKDTKVLQIYQEYLDKMNELEGVSDENN